MSFSVEDMLRRGGPCNITLWVKDNNTQASIQEPGSTGWNCVTRPRAVDALHEALSQRPIFRKAKTTEALNPGKFSTVPLPEAAAAAGIKVPAPVRKTAVIQRPDNAHVPLRVIRRKT